MPSPPSAATTKRRRYATAMVSNPIPAPRHAPPRRSGRRPRRLQLRPTAQRSLRACRREPRGFRKWAARAALDDPDLCAGGTCKPELLHDQAAIDPNHRQHDAEQQTQTDAGEQEAAVIVTNILEREIHVTTLLKRQRARRPSSRLRPAFSQATVLKHPERARASVIALHGPQRHVQPAWDDPLHNLDFGLLAKVAELVAWIAGATAHINAPLLRHPVAFLVDANNLSLYQTIRFRAQPHECRLADGQASAQRLVDLCPHPDRLRRDQREHGLARIGDAAELFVAGE